MRPARYWKPAASLCRSPGIKPPRVAFLFPGQGSQYVGMLQELVRDVPAAHAAMQQADELMRKHGFSSFGEVAWDAAGGAGTDIWATQSSMLLADAIMLAAIRVAASSPTWWPATAMASMSP